MKKKIKCDYYLGTFTMGKICRQRVNEIRSATDKVVGLLMVL
jgi:hypothetical protein